MAHSLYIAAGHVLHQLASQEGHVLLQDSDEAIRDVLAVAAQACKQFGEVEYERDQASREADALRRLLKHVEEVLASEPLPIDGGSWAVFELLQQVKPTLDRAGRG
jgi:hypothetical protein